MLAELAAVQDGRLNLGAVGAVDAELDSAVGQQQAIAGMHAVREPGERRRDAAGAAGEIAGCDAERVPGRE